MLLTWTVHKQHQQQQQSSTRSIIPPLQRRYLVTATAEVCCSVSCHYSLHVLVTSHALLQHPYKADQDTQRNRPPPHHQRTCACAAASTHTWRIACQS